MSLIPAAARFLRRLRATARLWRRRRDGVAFVEFAALAPVMAALLVGSVEMAALMAAKSRAVDASHTVADLIAQNSAVDDVRLGGIFKATDAVMETGLLRAASGSKVEVVATSAIACPCTPKSTKLCFTSLWSHRYKDGALSTGYAGETAMPQIPTAIAFNKNDTVIMTELTYTYFAPVDFILDTNPMTLKEISFHKPRFSDRVAHTGSQVDVSKRICDS